MTCREWPSGISIGDLGMIFILLTSSTGEADMELGGIWEDELRRRVCEDVPERVRWPLVVFKFGDTTGWLSDVFFTLGLILCCILHRLNVVEILFTTTLSTASLTSCAVRGSPSLAISLALASLPQPLCIESTADCTGALTEAGDHAPLVQL